MWRAWGLPAAGPGHRGGGSRGLARGPPAAGLARGGACGLARGLPPRRPGCARVRAAAEAGLGRGAPPVARRAGLGEASASGDSLAGQGRGRRGPAREERAAP